MRVSAETTPTISDGIISGIVFQDGRENDGGYQGSSFDNPIRCSAVSLTPEPNIDLGAGNGMPIWTNTDANGAYSFAGLPTNSNQYIVKIDSIPNALGGNAAFSMTDPADALSPNPVDGEAIFLLEDSQTIFSNQDFGVAAVAVDTFPSISGYIWGDDDLDGDSMMDGIDSPLVGVTVTVEMPGFPNNPPFSVQTNVFGYYEFGFLPANFFPDANCQTPHIGSQYIISVDTSTITGNYNPIPNYDPDNDGDTIATVQAELWDEIVIENVNFSFPLLEIDILGELEGSIYSDNDYDGTYSNGDTPYACTIVRLYPPSNVDLGSGVGQPVEQFTNAAGEYYFDMLPPDATYTVEVGSPNLYYSPSVSPFGLPDIPSDPSASAMLTVDINQPDHIQNFGYEPAVFDAISMISGQIWGDNNGDGTGVFDPSDQYLENLTVTLTPNSGTDVGAGPGIPVSVTTDESGWYYFEGVPYVQNPSQAPIYPTCVTPSDPLYTISVDTTTLPPEFAPETTYEPDNGNDATWETEHNLFNFSQSGNFSFAQATVTSIEMSNAVIHPPVTNVLVFLLAALILLCASYRLVIPHE